MLRKDFNIAASSFFLVITDWISYSQIYKLRTLQGTLNQNPWLILPFHAQID